MHSEDDEDGKDGKSEEYDELDIAELIQNLFVDNKTVDIYNANQIFEKLQNEFGNAADYIDWNFDNNYENTLIFYNFKKQDTSCNLDALSVNDGKTYQMTINLGLYSDVVIHI